MQIYLIFTRAVFEVDSKRCQLTTFASHTILLPQYISSSQAIKGEREGSFFWTKSLLLKIRNNILARILLHSSHIILSVVYFVINKASSLEDLVSSTNLKLLMFSLKKLLKVNFILARSSVFLYNWVIIPELWDSLCHSKVYNRLSL